MIEIGSSFMDTHNQCWGAWAVMGDDFRCRPELYLDRNVAAETRQKLAEYIEHFTANNKAAIRIIGDLI